MNQHTFSSHENCYTIEVALTDDYVLPRMLRRDKIFYLHTRPYLSGDNKNRTCYSGLCPRNYEVTLTWLLSYILIFPQPDDWSRLAKEKVDKEECNRLTMSNIPIENNIKILSLRSYFMYIYFVLISFRWQYCLESTVNL